MSELLDYQQGSDVALAPDGFQQVTNPLSPPKRSSSMYSHFPEDVYDLSPESHLSRLLKTLLGDAGVGQLQKRNMLARLQQTIGGVNFFDLDAFYGAVLGVRRRQAELLPKNPTTDLLTPAEWDQARLRDGSYRARVEQFAKALNLGATAQGIEGVAEALLGCQCDVYESWRLDDSITQTWAGMEATYATWDAMEGIAWNALESGGQRPYGQRHVITVLPHRPLSAEEVYSVQASLDRIRPAGCLLVVESPVTSAFLPVPIARVSADSEHWETRSYVRNTLVQGTKLLFAGAQDALVPVSPPAWGAYQGEAWSLMANNPIAIAYSTEGDVSLVDQVDPLASDMPTEKVRIGDQEVSFGPSNALLPIQATLAGRSVSDGVMVCNPHTGWNTAQVNDAVSGRMRTIDLATYDPSLPAELYVDGIPLDTLVDVITRDQAGRSAPLFWSSPPRTIDSPVNDVIEIRFDSEAEFDRITYEMAAFPQTIDVQAWVPTTGLWTTVHSQEYAGSNPGGINGAIPPGYVHPYHYGDGHWVKVAVSTAPTLASRIRFVFKRNQYGSPPLGYDGKAVAYPVGLRHVDVGYRLNSLAKVPNSDLSDPLITTYNIVGQPVQHSIVKYPAALAADGAETYWKCEAQPISQAVVNLYLDLSDQRGNPAVFDRLFLDPVTAGPTMNIYWSDVAPDGTDMAAAVSREEAVLPNVTGSVSSLLTGDQGLKWPKILPAYLDFDNSEMSFDPNKAFWWAAEFYPGFTPLNIPDRACLFSSGVQTDAVNYGDVSVVFNSAGSFTFRVLGISLSSSAWSWTPGKKVKIGGSWDPATQALTITVVNQDGTTDTVTGGAGSFTSSTLLPQTIRVGRTVGSSASNDVALDLTLLKMAIGYGTPDLSIVMGDAMETYVKKPRYVSTGVDRTAGTLLRFHPSYNDWVSPQGNSIGWMGGHLDLWSNVEWNPVAQDFVLTKGTVRLPLTRARFLKMEFSNLSPEPYEVFLAHMREVNLFPPSTTSGPSTSGRSIASDPTPVSPTFGGQISSRFPNAPVSPSPFERILSQRPSDPYSLLPSPTTGLVAIDPVTADRLSSYAGHGFDLQQWQPNRFTRQFTQKERHEYQRVVLNHTNKIAYFVGIREVQVSRIDPMCPIDSKVYVDPFWDTTNVASYTSSFDPGLFRTPYSSAPGVLVTPQVVTSRIFMSRTNVTEMQFATQQTPPQQILPDDLFRDPALATSLFSAPGAWHSYSDGRVIWDSTRQGVRVSRNPAPVLYYVELDTPMVHPPITPVFTTTPHVSAVISSAAQGGIESPSVSVSAMGMLNVAVRLTPLTVLSAPLYVQLIGSDGTTVLSEQSVTSQVNLSVEAVMPYTLGTNPLLEGTVTARVIQNGPYRDEWMMNAFSLYDDGLLWEFSNDGGAQWVPALGVRNNFAGVVNFPTASNGLTWRCTMYRQSVGINLIDIRPWYAGTRRG